MLQRINMRIEEGGEIWNNILIILQSLLNILLQNIQWIGRGKESYIQQKYSAFFSENFPASSFFLKIFSSFFSENFRPQVFKTNCSGHFASCGARESSFQIRLSLTIVNQWDIISYHIVPYHIISYCIIFYRWDRIV